MSTQIPTLDIRRFDTERSALQTITKRLREAFDPHGIFNPGRMG